MNTSPRKPASTANLLGWAVAIGILFFVAVFVFVPNPRDYGGRRSRCTSNLKQIGIALHNYHHTYHSFPPAYVTDADGQPMHSWRVLLLPFFEDVGAADLYKQYDLTEPWNGPHNSQLANAILPIYCCPSSDVLPIHTNYLAVVGPETAWPGDHALILRRDFKDGTSNTIMVVESADSGIHWMEPREITFDEAIKGINQSRNKPSVGSSHAGGANFLFVDGSVRFLVDSIDPTVFRGLLTANGSESVAVPD